MLIKGKDYPWLKPNNPGVRCGLPYKDRVLDGAYYDIQTDGVPLCIGHLHLPLTLSALGRTGDTIEEVRWKLAVELSARGDSTATLLEEAYET